MEELGSKIGKAVRILNALLLAAMGLLLSLGVEIGLRGTRERSLDILDANEKPLGPWIGTPPLFLYNEEGATAEYLSAGFGRFLRVTPNGNGAVDYNGFGFEGPFNLPGSASLSITWRLSGECTGLDLHLIDVPPPGFDIIAGEDFQLSLPLPDRDWTTAVVKLEDFRRNSWQSPDTRTDGKLNTKPLYSVEIGLHKGTTARLDISAIVFTWKPDPWPPIVLIAFLTVGAGILALRSSARLEPTGARAESMLVAALPRMTYLGFALAFLVANLVDPDLRESLPALGAFGASLLFAFTEDQLPTRFIGSRIGKIYYLPTAAILWFVIPSPNPLVVALVVATITLPALVAMDRPVFFGILAFTAALLPFHPGQTSVQTLFFHYVAMGVSSFTAYLLVAYFRKAEPHVELARALDLYEGLFTHSPDAIYTLAPDGRITNANLAFERLTGVRRSEAIGRPIADFLREEDLERCLFRARVDIPTANRFDAELKGPEGAWHPVLVNEHPVLKNGGLAGYQAIATDFTDRKRLEEELRGANRRLEALVHLDGLTGVNNRRSFDARLQEEWRRSCREGHHLGLLMVDIDHFKLYNDRYGHQGGDDCLRAVAAALAGALKRAGDFSARYGGEEFAIILPATDPDQVLKVAGHLAEAVRGLAIPHEASPTAPIVTISLGAASQAPVAGCADCTPEMLLARADAALYEAKRAGRNRAASAPPAAGLPGNHSGDP